MRHRLQSLCARAALASLALAPRPMAERLAGFYVGLLDLALPRLRRVAFRNLELALPELGQEEHRRIVAGSFRSIARLLVSLSRFSRLGPQNISQWIRYDGLEHFIEAKRQGRGVLFATAHLGNWELSAFAHAIMTEPMHIVVRPLDNPAIDSLVARLRTLSGNRIIEKKDYARGILRALARNEAVGILIDQNTSLEEGVFVDFFGTPACVGTGFAKIAAHSGAAIIAGFALWSEEEGRYILKFCPPQYATANTLEDTRRIHNVLEQVIRQYPDQWLWMHRRWKTRPRGEPPVY